MGVTFTTSLANLSRDNSDSHFLQEVLQGRFFVTNAQADRTHSQTGLPTDRRDKQTTGTQRQARQTGHKADKPNTQTVHKGRQDTQAVRTNRHGG